MNDKTKIITSYLRLYKEKGQKITMDDIAKDLSISKKTIYTIFKSKEDMFEQMINYCFDQLDDLQQTIVTDHTLLPVVKLSKLLYNIADFYSPNFSLSKVSYPEINTLFTKRVDKIWKTLLLVITDGQEDGIFKTVNPVIIRCIFEASLAKFYSDDFSKSVAIKPADAITEAIDTIVRGITIKNAGNYI